MWHVETYASGLGRMATPRRRWDHARPGDLVRRVERKHLGQVIVLLDPAGARAGAVAGAQRGEQLGADHVEAGIVVLVTTVNTGTRGPSLMCLTDERAA